MGSIFESPAPSSPPVPPPPPPANDEEEQERKRRLELIARRSRGRYATILTSPRGLLTVADGLPKRKDLLGA